MKNTIINAKEDLIKALELNGAESLEEIEEQFESIAIAMFQNFLIQKGDNIYETVEIEFYYNKTDEPGTNITIPRTTRLGEWFMHESGVDLSFKSDNNNYGGILIRTIKNNNGQFICGPRQVMWELFADFNAFESMATHPLIIPRKETVEIDFEKDRRWHVNNSDKNYRYYWKKDRWNKKNGYTAYPWRNDK